MIQVGENNGGKKLVYIYIHMYIYIYILGVASNSN